MQSKVEAKERNNDMVNHPDRLGNQYTENGWTGFANKKEYLLLAAEDNIQHADLPVIRSE